MRTSATIFFTAWIAYTAWCAAFGPPYNDAYGKIIHAAANMGAAAADRGIAYGRATCGHPICL